VQPDQLTGPRELLHDRRIVHPGRRPDVHYGHTTGTTDQQQVGHVPTDPPTVLADQLERLRGDADHIPVEVGQQNASQLQPALVGHQTLNRRRPVPARIVTLALVPTELTHRQSTRDFVHHHAIQRGVHELAVDPAIRHPDTAGSVLRTEGHSGDTVSEAAVSHDDTPDRFSSI
jgi:hypothetical protein